MAEIVNLATAPAAFAELLRRMTREELLGQQLVQRGALHAVEHLLSIGPNRKNAEAMVSSLFDCLALIEAISRDRGINLIGYEPPDDEASPPTTTTTDTKDSQP